LFIIKKIFPTITKPIDINMFYIDLVYLIRIYYWPTQSAH